MFPQAYEIAEMDSCTDALHDYRYLGSRPMPLA